MKKFSIFACGLMLYLLPLSIVVAENDGVDDDWAIPSLKENFHIFFLMGQSNMAGFAKVLPEDKKPVPHVVKIPTKGDVQWEPAAHPLHNSRQTDRFGLGLTFAKEYLKDKPGVTVGLIPVAVGGAAINALHKGSYVYRRSMVKAEYAIKSGTIKGVLWHQGESDSVNVNLANAYDAKLQQLIEDLRADLDNPKLPFIVGNLGEFYGEGRKEEHQKGIKIVKATLRQLPEKVKYTGFVESKGGKSCGRGEVHFDHESYITLGKRYAEAYSKIAKK